MTKANIMIVEDERIVARDIQTTLENAGYRVPAVVPSGNQAVIKATETPLDLVLMDVILMGEIDGIEAARRIRLHQDIPVIYLTANGDRAILDRVKETEPIAFIRKPYEEQELLTTIEVALHQYQSQKEHARVAVESSEARYQELFESARDGIAITDLSGYHLECNQAYLGLLGCATMAELPSRSLDGLTSPEFRDREIHINREQTIPRGYSDEYEKEYTRRDGSRVAVSARSWLRRDPQGRPAGLWLMVRDITERKRAERQLLEYQEQLQSLMKDLSQAEERERQRIASDIHDRISQTLAVCQMRLGAMAASATSAAVVQETQAVCDLLDRTIRDTSSLIFELSPPILHQLGLAPALEWFSEKIQKQHHLAVDIQARDFPNFLPADQQAALFRAVCELLNNVVKHARASKAQIRLDHVPGYLKIHVKDNGVGFIPSDCIGSKRDRGGFGLFHIRERIRAWGGTLDISSRPGVGTAVHLTLPEELANHHD